MIDTATVVLVREQVAHLSPQDRLDTLKKLANETYDVLFEMEREKLGDKAQRLTVSACLCGVPVWTVGATHV